MAVNDVVAYNTVQTMLNRLVEAGLAERRRNGRAFIYTAAVQEETYLSRAVAEQLDGTPPETARRVLRRALKEIPPRS